MATTQIDGGRQIKAGTITNTEIASGAAIALSKLAEAVIQADGGQAFTADQSLGGNKLTNVGTPSSATDAATKGYVDSVAEGLDVKLSVRAASTGNVNIASAPSSIDGITLTSGDRVLLKDQSTGSQNGIYVFNGAGSAMTRASDADTSAEVTPGMFTFVEEGTANGDSGWVLTTDAPITLGTTALSFSQFSSAASITAGAGLTRTGNTIDVVAGDSSLDVQADSVAVALNSSGGLETSTGVRVKLNGSTLDRSSSGLKVADAGVTETQLATSVAGNGLAGGGGTALSVNVDNSTLEINSDALRVKDAGITSAKLGAGARRAVREAPSGSINGSNTTFTLANTPVAGSEEGFLNGILQEPGAGNDYTISGSTITYLTAPLTGDRLRFSYMY